MGIHTQEQQNFPSYIGQKNGLLEQRVHQVDLDLQQRPSHSVKQVNENIEFSHTLISATGLSKPIF